MDRVLISGNSQKLPSKNQFIGSLGSRVLLSASCTVGKVDI